MFFSKIRLPVINTKGMWLYVARLILRIISIGGHCFWPNWQSGYSAILSY